MIKMHPYRAVGTVLIVGAILLLVAGMIGQYNDGPWGGLPPWVAAVAWFGFLASLLALAALSVYLLVANLQWRRAHHHQGHRV